MASNSSLSENKPALQNPFGQLEISFIMLLLKQFTNESYPLYASELADKMSHLTGEVHTTKSILRKLQFICELQNNPEKKELSNILRLAYGGSIVEVTNQDRKHSTAKKKQSKFYFEPLLSKGDVDLICGAITSNRYFSDSEKKYLISREQTLTSFMQKDGNHTKDSSSNSEEKEIKKLKAQASILSNLKIESRTSTIPDFLKHVNQLYDAIQNDYMISLVYGVYDSNPQHPTRVHFHAKNEKKPYKLNPYAMLWNNGAFYLLATHKGYTNPVHFRVDRIISIQPIKTEEDATKFQKRAALPDALAPFFDRQEFLPEKYTAIYPLMGIYDNTHYISCQLECTAATLSILIDTFGPKLSLIHPSVIPHTEDELDFHRRPQTFLTVRISSVQYDNILQFCLQQHTSITAISPPELVEDIQKNLEKSLHKSRSYQATLKEKNKC